MHNNASHECKHDVIALQYWIMKISRIPYYFLVGTRQERGIKPKGFLTCEKGQEFHSPFKFQGSFHIFQDLIVRLKKFVICLHMFKTISCYTNLPITMCHISVSHYDKPFFQMIDHVVQTKLKIIKYYKF